MLPGHAERLPAGRDHTDPGCPPDHLADQLGGGLEQVLAVVEDQQQLLVPEIRTEHDQRLGRRLVAEVEGP